jgi:uncharacterized membrane protein (UPF0127 family)
MISAPQHPEYRAGALTFATSPPTRFAVLEPLTSHRMIQGLQGFPPLAPDEGMVFFFPRGRPTMHMGHVDFAIAMIWLDVGSVTAVAFVRPGDKRLYHGPGYAVVEVLAEVAQRCGIKRGTEYSFAP